MSTMFVLGNPSPLLKVDVPDGVDENGNLKTKKVTVKHPFLNQSETVGGFWDGFDNAENVAHAVSTDNDRDLVHRHAALADEHKHYAIGVHELEHLWPSHSGAAKPSYVAAYQVGDDGNGVLDEALTTALAGYFACAAGRPTMLLTNGGRDAIHTQHWGTSTQPAQFNFLAISSNNGSGFAAADTTLASEITTNGLGRATATFAHTTGTNTSTLTKTWTYTGSTSQTIASTATFNAVSSGTLGEEDALSSSITVTTSGDTATVTYTGTAG